MFLRSHKIICGVYVECNVTLYRLRYEELLEFGFPICKGGKVFECKTDYVYFSPFKLSKPRIDEDA